MPQVYKDVLEFDLAKGTYDTQLLVESDVIVPESDPDVLMILAVTPRTYIKETLVTEGKIQFEGRLVLDILYLSEKNGELEKIEKEVDYHHEIEEDHIDRRSRSLLVASVENIDYKLINSRKINVRSVVKIECRLIVSERKEVVVGAEDSVRMQSLKKKVKLTHTIGQNTVEVFAKEKVKLPEGEAPIQKVIRVNAMAKPEEVKITENKVIVQGNIQCDILYISVEKQFGNLEANLTYANFVDIPGALNYMSANIQEEVIDVVTTVIADEKGENTLLEVEITMRVKVQVMETEEREIPVDAYGTKVYIQPIIENLSVIENVETFKSQFVVKTNLELPSLLKKCVDVHVIPVVSDYAIDGDKLIIEGILNYTILYLTEEENLKTYTEEYPFKTFVEIGDVKGSMLIDMEVSQSTYEVISMREIELKFAIESRVQILKEGELEVIVDLKEIEIPREEQNRHSIVIYILQKDETLWDIAKRYRVSLEDLIAANQLEEDKAIAGMKIIIPMEE
ncbi:MAG TPA: DUF3794 domain-containing protein [Clostridia bacterium]|nr:DUF3794 domain-containing protein [Clostridia bacterium]